MTINETESQPQAAATMSTGPGTALRQAREAKGWTQVEVARRLNLRLAVIESIDSDHYKAGVALTFLRGYIKAYAKVVGVSETQALAAFDSMSHEQFKSDEPMKSFSKKTRQQASDKWLKRISWLVFLGLLGSLVYWWWHDGARQQGSGVELEAEAQPAQIETSLAKPVLIDSSDVLLPLSPAETADADTAIKLEPTDALITEQADAISTDNNAVERLSADSDRQETASSTVTNARLLTLSFTDDCWIKITDSQGKVLSEGVKKAEQSLALEGEPPFKLILGVPTAVRVEYLSKAVDLSSFGTGRAARLTVPQS